MRMQRASPYDCDRVDCAPFRLESGVSRISEWEKQPVFLCNRCLCHCELSQGNLSVLYNADYGHRHGDFVPGQRRKNTDDGNIRASCDGVGRQTVETRKDRGI